VKTAHCDLLIQYALLEAGRQDEFNERELGPIHLVKYVYLGDLAYAERHNGESFTGASWIFYHYGPWAVDVHQRIEPALYEIHAQRTMSSSARYADDVVRWRLTDDDLHAEIERKLPLEVTTKIRRVVRQFGKDTGELLNYVYGTPPMLRARPRAELILHVAEPQPTGYYAPSVAPAPLSARQEKKLKERLANAKKDIAAKLAERRQVRAQRKVATPAPRYDEVYERGVAWLDEMAGEPEGEIKGEAIFDDAVWDSEARGDDRE
jgi:hypothetical protein